MKVQISEKIGKYFWTRYIPDSTYKTLAFISYINQSKESDVDYEKELMETSLGQDESISLVLDEKKRILTKLGLEYPESRAEDIALLETFRLIEKDTSENSGYRVIEDVQRPEEVLNLDEEETKALEYIKFEMRYANAINGILTLVLTNNRRLDCPVSHIINMTKVKIADIRTALEFLVNEEKSLFYSGNKQIAKLKKQDRVIITINDPIFNEKRFVVGNKEQ